MKGVVITEKNKNQVFGRLMKFFDHQDFIVWHQFSGGMRKRPGHMIKLTKSDHIVNVRRPYYSIFYEKRNVGQVEYLRVVMSPMEAMAICVGHEVWFLGNRIVIKEVQHWHDSTSIYRRLYMVFQIAKGWKDTESLQFIDEYGDPMIDDILLE